MTFSPLQALVMILTHEEIKVKYSENRRPTDTTDRITYPTNAVSKNEKKISTYTKASSSLLPCFFMVCPQMCTQFHKIPQKRENSTRMCKFHGLARSSAVHSYKYCCDI